MNVILSLIALLCVVQWQVAALQTHKAVIKFHKGNKNIASHFFTSNESFFYLLCNSTSREEVTSCDIHRISNVFGMHEEKSCDLKVRGWSFFWRPIISPINESLVFLDVRDDRRIIALDIDSCNYQEHEILNKDPIVRKMFFESYGINLKEMFSNDVVFQNKLCKNTLCCLLSYDSKGNPLYPPLDVLNPKFIGKKFIGADFDSSANDELNNTETKIYFYNKKEELKLLKHFYENEGVIGASGDHDFITFGVLKQAHNLTLMQFKQNGEQVMEYVETTKVKRYLGDTNLPNGGFLLITKPAESADDIVHVRKIDANGHLNGNVTLREFPTCDQIGFNNCFRIYESKDGEVCLSNMYVNQKTGENAFTIITKCFMESEIV